MVYHCQVDSANEELERLAALRESDDLTDAEYDFLKARLLEGVVPKDSDAGSSDTGVEDPESDAVVDRAVSQSGNGPSPGQSARICEQCGTSADVSSKFCGACGAQIGKNEMAASKPDDPTEPRRSPVEATPVGPVCRTCGKPVVGTAAICLNCGTNQRSSSHSPAEAAINAPEPKSVGIAVLLTILFPGAGHLYLGNSKKAIPFVIANAIGLGLAFVTFFMLFPITFVIWLVTLIMTAPGLSKETAEHNSNLS